MREKGRRNPASHPRDLPNRIRRLIDLGNERRKAVTWIMPDPPDDLFGVIVVRDSRD
jgi:hypothetical protein